MADATSSSRKRRTREHVIADLSVNHVERQALLCGFSVERRVHDYGVDLVLLTYTDQGVEESGEILLQVKSTESASTVAKGRFVSVRIERAHLRAWLAEPMPVILVVYDVSRDRAYWLYVQGAFSGGRRFKAATGSKRVSMRIPATQVLDPNAIARFRDFKAAIVAQFERIIHEHG